MNPNGTDTLAEHVQLVRLADMAGWERNPHKHPESQLSTLASLVRRFGFTSLPVLATYPGCETGFVSSGNGRLAVLRLLKSQYPQNPPPGIGVAPDGEWLIPCRPMTFPSKAEAEAQGLSDNWVASMPGVEDDSEILAEILHDLQEQEIDFSGLGKDMEELAAVLADPPVEPSADDDGAPEPPAEPISRLGEVYELGPHRLVCGDSTSADSWALLLPGGERLQMVWTDPPYGVAIVGGNHSLSPEERAKKGGKTIQNDALTPEQLEQFLRDALGIAAAHCLPGAAWYVAAPQMPIGPYVSFVSVMNDIGIARHMLIWVKNSLVMGRSDYHYRHEPIFYGWVPGAAHYFVDDRTQDSVLEFDRPGRSADHPTMKPVGLVAKCIENSSKPGWIIGEPFGGSGTTLIAAAQTGRIARLIELDPRYCDVIRRRWTAWAKQNNREVGTGGLE